MFVMFLLPRHTIGSFIGSVDTITALSLLLLQLKVQLNKIKVGPLQKWLREVIMAMLLQQEPDRLS